MFEKFGEFDSAEELNRAANAQKEEGDLEALIVLAEENGIDKEDAEDFADGLIDSLVNEQMAAVGKLNIEIAALGLKGVLLDWSEELKALALENTDFAIALRKKGKKLAKVIAIFAEYGFENSVTVSKEIVALAPKIKGVVGNHDFKIGFPDKAARERLAREYYLGDKS